MASEHSHTEVPTVGSSLWPLFLTLSAVLLFQLWFLGFWPGGKVLDDKSLSDPYTAALATGHAYLLQQPDPRVVAAKDPFAAVTRGLLVWDSSYFRGHFYMYFGIVPFLLLMVPYFLVVGCAPGPSLAILVFITFGFISYAGTLALIRRKWAPRSSQLMLCAAFLCIILSSGALSLMSRPAIYEIENASAFACFGIGTFFLFAAEVSLTRGATFSTLAAVFLSLTMGCRPNYFPAVTILCFWLIFGPYFKGKYSEIKFSPRNLAGPLIAIAAVAIGLAFWNYHRFGNVTDFGLKHTVSEDPSQIHSLASIRNLPFGISRYSLGFPRIGRYFPFIEGQHKNLLLPARAQEDSNQVYGFLLVSPILLFSICAAASLRRTPHLSTLCAFCYAAFAGNFLFLSSVTMSCYRYPADFLAPLSLTAAIAILNISDRTKSGRLFASVLTISLIWNTISQTCVLFSIAENSNLFVERRPQSFHAISSLFNRPIYLAETLTKRGPSALRLTLKFPDNQLGKSEPLVVLGEPGAQDFIYVYYAGKDLLRIGLMSTGLQDLQSALVNLDFKSEHVIEIYLGSLLPPDGDPLVRGIPSEDLALARKAVYLRIDGQTVQNGFASLHRPRAYVQIGESVDDQAFGRRFSGKITGIDDMQIAGIFGSPRWKPDCYLFPTFEFSLLPMPEGVYDPIVSMGSPGAGAELLVQHLHSDECRLVWISTDAGRLEGPVFPLNPKQILRVRIEAGALFPPLASSLWPAKIKLTQRIKLKSDLKIFFNERVAIQGDSPELDVPPDMIKTGVDALTSLPGVLPVFPGHLVRTDSPMR